MRCLKARNFGLLNSTASTTRGVKLALFNSVLFGHCFWGNLLFFFSGIPPPHSAQLFFLHRRTFFNSYAPPAAACCFCELDISSFRKSVVIHAYRVRAPDCRVTRDCEASNVQGAVQNGVPPLPGNKRLRSNHRSISIHKRNDRKLLKLYRKSTVSFAMTSASVRGLHKGFRCPAMSPRHRL